jgi:hypothetical protein
MQNISDDKVLVAIAQTVELMKSAMPAQQEIIMLQAKLTRIRYNELLAQGFTKDEALILCTKSFSI